MAYDFLINPLFTAVVSGSAVAIVTLIMQRHIEKRNIVLKLSDDYLKMSKERAIVEFIFKSIENDDSCSCIIPEANSDSVKKNEATTNYNYFIGVADWYEIVATLILSRALDHRLLDTLGIRGKLDKFKNRLFSIKHERIKEFRKYWPNLYRMYLSENNK